MSDEKRPFAQADGDAVEMASIRLLAPGHSHVLVKSYANEINAAVERERREAAVKALREAADTVLDTHDGPAFRMIGSLDDGTENRRMFRDWLLRHSAKIERGEQ